jgi:hypothetical protein
MRSSITSLQKSSVKISFFADISTERHLNVELRTPGTYAEKVAISGIYQHAATLNK